MSQTTSLNKSHRTISRRSFVSATGLAAGATALGGAVDPLSALAAPVAGKLPRRILGRTKLEVTCMTLGAAPCGIADDVSIEEVSQIVNLAIDLGINSIDTTPMKVFGGPDEKTGSWGTRKAKPRIGEKNIELAIRYALGVPGVATANLGVHTAEQLRQNVEYVARYQPLSITETADMLKQGKEMAAQWGAHFGPVT